LAEKKLLPVEALQGDQIGRIFARRVILSFGSYCKCTAKATFFGYFIPWLSLSKHFYKKMYCVVV
jgi:hypothetical protein